MFDVCQREKSYFMQVRLLKRTMDKFTVGCTLGTIWLSFWKALVLDSELDTAFLRKKARGGTSSHWFYHRLFNKF